MKQIPYMDVYANRQIPYACYEISPNVWHYPTFTGNSRISL